MNNTASISIMLPVALAVVHELGIYSENSLNTQEAAVISVVFDSQMEKGPTKTKLKNSLILLKYVKHRIKSETFVETNTHFKLLCCKRQKPEVDDRSKKSHDQLKKGFLLAVAYSSSIDGLSRLFQCRPPSEMFEVQTHLKAMLNKRYKNLGRPKHITDGTVAIFCGILPLILPDSNPFNRNHDWKYESIVKWTPLAQNMSWGSILLLGAGLTIATAFEVC
ncbi:unnamed protein product [Rotaria magnacalcarata]|uniref:Uncharacterized protein n=1 Tax=Rotaria magnacalcarata TaxID=392030 RepID=A0A8S2Y515_9BILA|nr:unnamed protein product [Rotaria magnacalcarata]